MVEATCPKCNAKFELGDEFVGATVQCGACGTPFKVGQAGGGESDIEIVCPGCKTVHQVPGNGRGSEAECMICGLTFKIPAEGNQGIAAGPINKAPRPAPQPSASAAGGIDKNTSTIRLSRSSLSNTMQSRPKTDPITKSATGQLPPASGKPSKPSGPPPAKPSAPPAPSATKAATPVAVSAPVATTAPVATAPAAPAPAPAAVPASPRTVAMGPIPNLGVKLNADENAVVGKEHAAPFPALVIFLTLLPVILVPVTAMWYGKDGGAMALVVGAVVSLAAWAFAAFTSFSNWQKRSGLLITNKRAIMVVQDQIVADVPMDK